MTAESSRPPPAQLAGISWQRPAGRRPLAEVSRLRPVGRGPSAEVSRRVEYQGDSWADMGRTTAGRRATSGHLWLSFRAQRGISCAIRDARVATRFGGCHAPFGARRAVVVNGSCGFCGFVGRAFIGNDQQDRNRSSVERLNPAPFIPRCFINSSTCCCHERPSNQSV
jgi:hypothetical protein